MASLIQWHKKRAAILVLAFIIYTDVFVCLLQYAALHGWDGAAFEPATFFPQLLAFNSSTADMIVLSVLRALFVPLLVYLAIVRGAPAQALQALAHQHAHKDSHALDKAEKGHAHRKALDIDIEAQPLLDKATDAKPADAKPVLLELSYKEKNEAKKEAELRKHLLLGLAFVFLTLCQVHTGIKVVVYSFSAPTQLASVLAAAFTCSSVLWMNVELFLGRSLADSLTKDKGELFPELHIHPLHYREVSAHMCDYCRRRGLREAFSCADCNYDLCIECTKKKTKSRGEGLLRGDKGAVQEKEVSNWQYVKKGLQFASPHWILIGVALLMMLITSACQLLLPNYQGRILDHVIKGDFDLFGHDIRYFLGISLAVGLFGGIRGICFNLVGQKMSVEIRQRLFNSVIIQDIAYFDGTTTGDITSRLSQDTSAMVAPTRTMLSSVLSNILYLGGGLVMCLWTSWRLSVLAFTTIGPIILVYRVYSKWSRGINSDIWAALGDASSIATEAIGNIRTVRAFGTEELEIKKYQTAIDESLQKGIKDAYAGAGAFALTNYIDLGISVLLLWYGGSVVMAKDGRLTVGSLITFQLYWGMIGNAYSSLSDLLTQFTRAGGAAQRVLNLMDHLPDIHPNQGKPVLNLKGDLSLKGVEFAYQMRPDQQVLKGVNLSIESGKVLALVGRSGGGKSTLIHLMLRFYNPTAGTITLDGQDISHLNPASYRHYIGLVAQETQLFSSTVEENIAYGVQNYTHEDLVNAATLANAHDFISKFEDGYRTRVGERGIRLSGGQKQRIAIARAFLRRPKLLFLDEATSSLDAESEHLVQEAIDKLIETVGCTVVLVAHRLSTVINANKIAVIDKGEVVEQGSHDELVKQGGVYAKLVQRQIARMQNTLENENKGATASDVIDKLLEQK